MSEEFKAGDVAYISSWNHARRLITSIADGVAECLDERGKECRHDLRALETLDQWLVSARRCAEDTDLKMSEVRAYVDAATAPFEPPAKWGEFLNKSKMI